MTEKKRNVHSMIRLAEAHYQRSVDLGLMQVTLRERKGKRVVLADGTAATEFINCSYLGLDEHPAVVAAASDVVKEWGVHFCCARSRFSIGPNAELEAGLSELFRGRAITFPSVTSAHMSVLPLLAAGALLPPSRRAGAEGPVRLVFDRFAHASMQFLRPLLAEDARVVTLEHNDLEGLAREARSAHDAGETPVFVADGVYSMGGTCPLDELFALARDLELFLYIDDAHGTSIFGERGEGYAVSKLKEVDRTDGPLPEHLMVTYSLAKGFGTNGGGVVVPSSWQERIIRSFGQTYAFSAPLDFSIQAAALASLKLHHDGTVRGLQERLRDRVARFDARVPEKPSAFSPIRMVPMPTADDAIAVAERLKQRGYFVTVALFPVVPRARPQLRICLATDHSDDDIDGLTTALAEERARVSGAA